MMKVLFKSILSFIVSLFGHDEETQKPYLNHDGEEIVPLRRAEVHRLVAVGEKKVTFRSHQNPERVLVAKIVKGFNPDDDTYTVRRGGQTFKISMWEKASRHIPPGTFHKEEVLA